MEIDYGRIKIHYKNDLRNILSRFLICIECSYGNTTKGGIETHLAKKHNQLQLHSNLKCPYCPKSHIDLGSLNRHLYKKLYCAYIKEKYIFTINWKEVWLDICREKYHYKSYAIFTEPIKILNNLFTYIFI